MLYFSNSYPPKNVYIKDSLNLDSYEEKTDKQMITEYIDSLLCRGFYGLNKSELFNLIKCSSFKILNSFGGSFAMHMCFKVYHFYFYKF